MPLIPVSPAQRQAQTANSGVNPIRASREAVEIEALRTTPDFDKALGPLSDKARRRGGEYHLGHGIQDAAGGLLKGAALIPDGVLNLIARSAEVKQGLEKGSLGRDFLNRSLRAGNYEDVDWLVISGAGRTEIGFGAASGMGAGIEQEVYGTSGLTGGLIAPFAAPFVMGAARGVWNSSPTRWIVSSATNKLRGGTVGVADDMNAARQVAEEGTGNVARAEESAAARQQVNETLDRARSDPRYADNQRINEAIQDEFGKFFPDGIVPMSVASQLQDPLTTARTRMALMRSGPEAIEAELQNTNDILNIIQNYYDDTLSIQVGMGGEAGSAATVVHAFKDEVAALNSGARNELGELTTQLEDLVPGFNQSNRDATGAELRSKIDDARNLQFERAQAKADELGINKDTGGDQLGSAADWQRFSQTVQDEFLPVAGFNSMTADMLPDEIKRVFRKAAQEGDEFRLSFQDWKNVREDLTTSINRLYNNQDSNGAGRLKIFANMWDEFGSGVTAPNRTPGVTSPALATGSQFGSSTGKKYLDYIDWYKTNVAGPFENQIMINVRQRAGGSATQPIYQTGAENVANQF